MGNHTNRGQVHNNLNHLLEDSDYTYSYTTNGQLSRKVNKITGEKTEYGWNVEGKTIQTTVRKADNSIKAQVISRFDPFDRRVVRISGSDEIRYAYDSEDIVVEFGTDNSVRAIYLHGPGIDEPIAMVRDINKDGTFEEKELFFYSKDHLNSIHDLTDYLGKPVQRYNYTAYGKTKVESTNSEQSLKLVHSPYGYTSREWEQETGDYYYRARNYDPSTGRFLTLDPIGFAAGDANLYRYVKNNPIRYSDPMGLDFRICSRPLNMSLPDNDPFRHYYIRFDDGDTISYGVDENGNPTRLPEGPKPKGESCGKNIKSSKKEDEMMKRWASQHYNDPYDSLGHNCKSFVGRATTEFWSAK